MSNSAKAKTTLTPFKEFINPQTIQLLAKQVSATKRPFRRSLFTRRALKGLDDLEMKQRVRQVSESLRAALDPAYETALATLVEALPPAQEGTEDTTNGFLYWPFLQFVEDFGPSEKTHYTANMQALHAMTQRFSAEFAIRPFLAEEPDRTLAVLQKWSTDSSPHVRRLCSEGSRPRLPWGLRLNRFIEEKGATTPLLDALVDDPEEYVRRSVANHVNDIAKDHPDLSLELCGRWLEQAAPQSGQKNRQRLIRHALRSLIKQGSPEALALIGYRAAQLKATLELEPEAVKLSEHTVMKLRLQSAEKSACPLLIDYAVHFIKANGSLSPKVFKWTEKTIEAKGELTIERKHVFRAVTTRRHYPGRHRIEILVNGKSVADVAVQVN